MNKLRVHASDDRDFVIRLDRHVRATVQNPLHSHSDDVYSSAIVPSRFTTPLQFSIKLPPNLIVDWLILNSFVSNATFVFELNTEF